MAAAMEWVSRIFAVSLEMFLPGLGGQWLDGHFGTQWIGLTGFALGLGLGLWHLLLMTARTTPPQKNKNKE
jgi:hypothetical protein